MAASPHGCITPSQHQSLLITNLTSPVAKPIITTNKQLSQYNVQCSLSKFQQPDCTQDYAVPIFLPRQSTCAPKACANRPVVAFRPFWHSLSVMSNRTVLSSRHAGLFLPFGSKFGDLVLGHKHWASITAGSYDNCSVPSEMKLLATLISANQCLWL